MQSIMEILTDKMTGLIESSASLAIHSKNSEIRNLHLLWALTVDSSSILNQIFNKFDINAKAVELEIKSKISNLPTSSNVSKENIKISNELANSLENAKGLMSATGDKFIAVDTWISANLENAGIKEILSKFCDILEFKKEFENLRSGSIPTFSLFILAVRVSGSALGIFS